MDETIRKDFFKDINIPKVGCAVCGKTNVTLLKREDKRICRTCYGQLLQIRTLSHQ